MFQLFTDTDTDITPEVAKEYNYKLISMPYVIDGKEIYPYEDFETFDYPSYYGELRKGVLPTTCALSPTKYAEYFEPTLKEGKDIVYVHFSAAMSGTFNAMRIAWESLSEKYGVNAIGYGMKVFDEADVNRIFDDIRARGYLLDTLVCCAGELSTL